MSYLAASSTFIYILLYFVLDMRTYAPVIIINIVVLVLLLMIPFVHRFHELAGAVLLALTEYIGLLALTAYLGRPSGIHLQYVIGASASFLIFGLNRLWLIAAFIVIGFGFHLFAWFYFSRHDAILFVNKTTLSNIYINAAATTFIVTAAITYYAVRLADKAEAELEGLLHNILPEKIVERLKDNPKQQIADHYDEASVLFADLVGFTPISKELGIKRTSRLLNKIIKKLDDLAKQHGVEKIKTIGDAYMAVTGVPSIQEDHGKRLGIFALGILDMVKEISETEDVKLHVRIGLASGPLMAGLVGQHKFAYDIWGDTVNLASRMESQGSVNQIQVNDTFKEKTDKDFIFTSAGVQDIRGVGPTQTWFLEKLLDK